MAQGVPDLLRDKSDPPASSRWRCGPCTSRAAVRPWAHSRAVKRTARSERRPSPTSATFTVTFIVRPPRAIVSSIGLPRLLRVRVRREVGQPPDGLAVHRDDDVAELAGRGLTPRKPALLGRRAAQRAQTTRPAIPSRAAMASSARR